MDRKREKDTQSTVDDRKDKSNDAVHKVQTARRMLHQIERSNTRRIRKEDMMAAELTIRESEKSETELLHYIVDAETRDTSHVQSDCLMYCHRIKCKQRGTPQVRAWLGGVDSSDRSDDIDPVRQFLWRTRQYREQFRTS